MPADAGGGIAGTLSDLFGLEGKVAFVTGAARGIGLGIAEALVSAGADVVLGDLNFTGAEASAAAIRERGGKASAVLLDVSEEASVVSALAQIQERQGRLDILVNSAGIFPNRPIREMDSQLWDKVLSVNLRGAFLTIRHGAELIIAGGKGGRIINIASINVIQTYIGMAHYDASKAGMVGLARAAALEYAPFGITANVIAPGAVITPGAMANFEILATISGGTADNAVEDFASKIPNGRWASPKDIGRAVLMLSGHAADYITGQTIFVDGGLGLI